MGENSSRPYENDWNKYKAIVEPKCSSLFNSSKKLRNFLLIVVKSAVANVKVCFNFYEGFRSDGFRFSFVTLDSDNL